MALGSINIFLIEGARELSGRSADALAQLLRDVQEVELRGSARLTPAAIGEGGSFRKWCRAWVDPRRSHVAGGLGVEGLREPVRRIVYRLVWLSQKQRRGR